MALNRNPSIERPDHSTVTVGNEGDPTAQEPESGKNVTRKGASAEQADIDVAAVNEPYDLVAEGDYASGQRDTGGAEGIAGDIESADGNTFTVEIDWLSDDGEVLKTHAPSAMADAVNLDFNIVARSDHFEVRITDTSNAGSNGIHGTVNAH